MYECYYLMTLMDLVANYSSREKEIKAHKIKSLCWVHLLDFPSRKSNSMLF